ncbi:DNA-binding response regulator, partial [Pseudomonas sp. ATCC 13867]
FAMRCMQAGASGFVCKQGGLAELISAVSAVVAGYNLLPQHGYRQTRRNNGQLDDQELIQRLSDREMAVLQYLANGYSNKEISEQ